MQCEVCGRQIFGAPIRSIIEGAKMTVCSECAKLGSGYWEPKPQRRAKKSIKRQPTISFSKRKQRPTVTETLELVGDFGQRVRQAREGLGLSHEDLGRKIREKVSVIRKIESGKMIPDLVLAEKLEHALKIKLRVPASEPNVQPVLSSKPRGTTLGDLIQFKVKEKEAQK
ncbi:MAG: multiprotein bridging factor aMBF1 [Candidatus Bathyarchaeota archaeon]|nr:multiprotein bridging factor aMBF1 [Candidatus Bathyarchaeota archaeon]